MASRSSHGPLDRLAALANSRSWLLKGGRDFEDPHSESARAREHLEVATGKGTAPGLIVLVEPGAPATSPGARATVARLRGLIVRDPAVADVADAHVASVLGAAGARLSLAARDGDRLGRLRAELDSAVNKEEQIVVNELLNQTRHEATASRRGGV